MLKESIQNQTIEAMKSKDKETLTTLRLISATIKNKEIDTKESVSDEEVIAIIQKEIKQTNESIEAFSKSNNHQHKIDELNNRVTLLTTFLPKQLSEEEIDAIVVEKINEAGISSKKEMGKVMALIMPVLKGKADGKVINKIVSKHLN